MANQDINISTYTLTITGLVQTETVLTYDQIVNTHAHYLKVATLHCVEGWEVTVLLKAYKWKTCSKKQTTAKTPLFSYFILKTASHEPPRFLHSQQQHHDGLQSKRTHTPKKRRLPIPTCRRRKTRVQMGKMDNQNRSLKRHELSGLLGKPRIRQRRKLAVKRNQNGNFRIA